MLQFELTIGFHARKFGASLVKSSGVGQSLGSFDPWPGGSGKIRPFRSSALIASGKREPWDTASAPRREGGRRSIRSMMMRVEHLPRFYPLMDSICLIYVSRFCRRCALVGPSRNSAAVTSIWRETPLASHFLSSFPRIAQNLSCSSSCSFERAARAGRMRPGDCPRAPRREWCGVRVLAVGFPQRRA